MSKKILFVSIGGAIILLVIIGSFALRSKTPSSGNITPYTAISTQATFVEPTAKGILAYNADNLQFSLTTYGGQTQLLGQLSRDPTVIIYDPTGQSVATQLYESDGSYRWEIHTLATGALVSALDPSIQTIAFSPDGKRIAYQFDNGQISNISIADLQGKNWLTIVATTNRLNSIWWLNHPETYLVTLPAFADSSYQLIGLSSKQAATVTQGDSTIKPNPTKQLVLLGHAHSYEKSELSPTLTLATIGDNGLDNQQSLSIASYTDFSAWDRTGKFLYVAVPTTIGNNSYQLIQYDTETNKETTILTEPAFTKTILGGDTTHLLDQLIAVDGKTLFAVIDHELRSIALP